MSSLNLTPDPAVLAVQTALFFTALAIVRHLVVNPYLELKSKRDAKTVGAKEQAGSLGQQTATLIEQVNQKYDAAARASAAEGDRLRQIANDEKTKTLSELDKVVRKNLQENEVRIKGEVAAERANLAKFVDELAEEICQRAIH